MKDQQKTQKDSLKESNNADEKNATSQANKSIKNKKSKAEATNENIENHKEKEQQGYKIAIEDTMIGYDGREDQINVDLENENLKSTNSRGVDDND